MCCCLVGRGNQFNFWFTLQDFSTDFKSTTTFVEIADKCPEIRGKLILIHASDNRVVSCQRSNPKLTLCDFCHDLVV